MRCAAYASGAHTIQFPFHMNVQNDMVYRLLPVDVIGVRCTWHDSSNSHSDSHATETNKQW